MSQFPDLEILKEIPGYQAILKAVLKSQIQLLVEQLSDQTGEESVLLTASITDGTLCHLGSESGKVFLQDHEDFKSQFLGFCLKRNHKRKSSEASSNRKLDAASKRPRPYEPYPQSPPSSQLQPVSMHKVTTDHNDGYHRRPRPHTSTHTLANSTLSGSYQHHEKSFQGVAPSDNALSHPSDTSIIKQEIAEQSGQDTSTDTANYTSMISTTDTQNSNFTQSISAIDSGHASIKQESDEDLEITGVDISNVSEVSQMSFDQQPSQWLGNLAEGYDYGSNTDGSSADPATSGNNDSQIDMFRGDLCDSQDNGDRTHQCKYCDVVMKTKHALIQHVRIHTGERPFECSYCHQSFSQKGVLTRHLLKHTGELPFACHICDKAFSRKAMLNLHKYRVHQLFIPKQ